MHPLDLVKTRLQVQKSKPGDPHHYSGVWDCMRKMQRAEGFFALWKGILPPILAETPKRAVKVIFWDMFCSSVDYESYINIFYVMQFLFFKEGFRGLSWVKFSNLGFKVHNKTLIYKSILNSWTDVHPFYVKQIVVIVVW